MTEIELRDHFAMNAPDTMAGFSDWTAEQCMEILGLPKDTEYDWAIHYIPLMATLRYQYADAMLEARKQGVSPPKSKKNWKKFGEKATTESALDRFNVAGAHEEPSPVERLRFFCSLAMNMQDWLDVEPFFDALTESQACYSAADMTSAAAQGFRNGQAMAVPRGYQAVPNDIHPLSSVSGCDTIIDLLRNPPSSECFYDQINWYAYWWKCLLDAAPKPRIEGEG